MGRGDSRATTGGVIPGSGGAPAFRLLTPSPSAIPVLIAVPHAGRAYPPALLGQLRSPAAALRLEDRLADRLGEAVAQETGAALLVAEAPRAMIDLNRSPEDIDWSMLDNAGEAARGAPRRELPGGRARGGLGLIPRRLPGFGELWRRPQPCADLAARIEGVHQPYHACLANTLAELRARWGACLLVDLHSMPPLPLPAGDRLMGRKGAQFVLGDRFGASCHGALVASAFSCLAEGRWLAAHNRPYAGGYGLERHGAPRQGVHALQIEVDRSCYLDSRLVEAGEGFAAVVALLVGMVRRLAGEVAALGMAAGLDSAWPEAAE